MHIEFFGIPRERAGVAKLEVQAATLGQLMNTLATRFPSLEEAEGSGRLHSAFAVNLNGDQFISDPQTPLHENDCVLILSADAGG